MLEYGQSDRKTSQDTKQNQHLLHRIRSWLFDRSFCQISFVKLSYTQAVILFLFEQTQKFAIVNRLSVNPTISQSPQMVYVDAISRYILLDISDVNSSSATIISVILLMVQLLLLFTYTYPFSNNANAFISKYLVSVVQMSLIIPSIVHSSNGCANGANIALNGFLFLLTMANNIVYETTQFECSFERQSQNLLVRSTRSLTLRLFILSMICLFPFLTRFIFPNSLIVYVLVMLVLQSYKWYYYVKSFIYFNELFMKLKGVMLSLCIAANLCFVAIYTLDNAIIAQNVLLFISTFCLFLGNFFIVYRNNVIKSTIINKSMRSESEICLYCLFYWHCYKNSTDKKSELYISSLLKKHMNECLELSCCCKNRQLLYDSNLKTFGNAKMQPHFDKVFIRHFIKKLISDGYDQFNKSSTLTFLLSYYNVEILEMIPQTIQLIHKLTRMQQKKQLQFSQQYLLHCLKKKTNDKILVINHKRGNLDIESIKRFDEQLVILNLNLRQAIRMYFRLWKNLQNKLNEAILLDICKKSLELMFSIEKNYKELKSINTESSELRTIMLFYSKIVLHDIHLLSEVRKDIKISHQRNIMLSSIDTTNIQLFGTKTITLIALQNNRIKWSSKNAHTLFEYSREQFHTITVKHLMPKYFAQNHDSYVQKWKDSGYSLKLNRNTYQWGTKKDGTCFSMLFYVKVIPLLHQQDFAFSCCMQKVDDQNEIICSSYGQVYGSGKLFTDAIGVNPKLLQQVKINIQIFMPMTFDYFLEYFYPSQKLKNVRRNYEVRRQGYFPQNMQKLIQELLDQRTAFLLKFKGNQNYNRQYLSFIKQKMQELTCNVNGNYISFLMMPYKIECFKREKKQIIVLKISNLKRDNIQKFYLELQKIISKLTALMHQDRIKSHKSLQRKKTQLLRSPANPQDIKFIAEEYKKITSFKEIKDLAHSQGSNPNKPSQNAQDLKRTKYAQSKTQNTALMGLAAHRKRLGKGSVYTINNEKVRYNVWKLKKLLLKQGLISKYTFNVLIGSQLNLQMDNKQTRTHKGSEDALRRTLMDVYEQKNDDDSEQASLKKNSEGELAPNRANDMQTFNSGSSGATFISMTNHVKMFKEKLRSLNTPQSLWILNVVLMVVVMGGVAGLIYSVVSNLSNLSYGLIEFGNNQQTNLIVDGLILGQLNIPNINHNNTNSYYQLQKAILLQKVTRHFRQHNYNRAQEKKVDPYLLSYLRVMITGNKSMQIRDFLAQVINQMINDNFQITQVYFNQTIDFVLSHSSSNKFFDNVIACILTVFIVFLVTVIVLWLITIPIVYKIQIKIKQIYELLSKISPNDKNKYFKHFSYLDDTYRKQETIQFNDLTSIMQNFDSKFKNKPRVSTDQQPLSENNRRIRVQTIQNQKSTVSSNKAVYIKLLVTYLVIISTILAYYLYLNSAHSTFIQASTVFTDVFNQKTLFSYLISECVYEMMGFPQQAKNYDSNVNLVTEIYNSYHLKGISSNYMDYMNNFIVSQTCTLISDSLTPNQINFCQNINNATFMGGGIDNLYYTQRKIQQRLSQYYQNKNNSKNPSIGNDSSYFLSEQFQELNIGYFFSSLMLQKLFDRISWEMDTFCSVYNQQIQITTYLTLLLMGVFTTMWIYIYLKLAENASYINAFLLLIPFDVLSQNPYIKLYIRNQFDIKSANY